MIQMIAFDLLCTIKAFGLMNILRALEKCQRCNFFSMQTTFHIFHGQRDQQLQTLSMLQKPTEDGTQWN